MKLHVVCELDALALHLNHDNSIGPDKAMALLKFLDTKDIEEFATTLANDLGRRFPPASEARTDPGAKHQIKVILEGLTARAIRYQLENKLGIYKKAKLGNVFKWKLKDLGYSDEFAERATKEIVTRLAVSRR